MKFVIRSWRDTRITLLPMQSISYLEPRGCEVTSHSKAPMIAPWHNS